MTVEKVDVAKKAAFGAAFFASLEKSPYWQMCWRPSPPRNQMGRTDKAVLPCVSLAADRGRRIGRADNDGTGGQKPLSRPLLRSPCQRL